MKKKLNAKTVALAAFVATTALASAEPVALDGVVTDLKAQVSSVISDGLPLLAVILGGAILYKMARKFFK